MTNELMWFRTSPVKFFNPLQNEKLRHAVVLVNRLDDQCGTVSNRSYRTAIIGAHAAYERPLFCFLLFQSAVRAAFAFASTPVAGLR